MTIKEAVETARRAFASGEVSEYLSGKKDYSKTVNRFVAANVPTDFEYIVKIGIYEFYKASPQTEKSKIVQKYKEAIFHLTEGDCLDVWCAYMIAHLQDYFEKNNVSPFSLISQDLVDSVSSALITYKEELENCFLYVGKNQEKGLWQEIERINCVYSAQGGVNFL